jgi:hypothetical protein
MIRFIHTSLKNADEYRSLYVNEFGDRERDGMVKVFITAMRQGGHRRLSKAGNMCR